MAQKNESGDSEAQNFTDEQDESIDAYVQATIRAIDSLEILVQHGERIRSSAVALEVHKRLNTVMNY